MADAIFKALEMEPAEKHARLQRMQKRISSYNVYAWAFDFFNQTSEIKKQQDLTNIRLITDSLANKIITDYHNASSRILFLDYDGTLVSFTKYPELTILDVETVEIIKKLTIDPKNQIVIISGRSKEFLEKEFLGINITLVAEHGYFIKFPGKGWNTTIETGPEWKNSILPILNEYVNRCNGTSIEEKTGSIAWHYRNADSDFAQLRLHELRDDLTEIIRHKTDFEILEGNKVLEVKSGKYDKGQAAKTLMKNKHFDFVLAAGDDRTDESLFKQLNSSAYTIRVGLSPSMARFNISDFYLLIKLLKDLAD